MPLFVVVSLRSKDTGLKRFFTKKSHCQEFCSSLLSCPNVMGQKKNIPLWILQREVKDWEAPGSPGDTEYIQSRFEKEFELRGWD